uniref:probable WRKY transcription factor protein 1 n=1 Tax=Erigeron canadensis TaxID=72917 RepID=UPI001CB9CFEA|nr:probable WRKY transcription factor protein 1 [Erigeron canadensis]
MDSSNSGSFQSSSGGAATGAADAEEYDSRTQSISSFLNPTTSNFNNLNHLLQPPPPPLHSDSTSFFNPNPFHDPGSLWTGPLQPANRSNLTNFNTTTNYANINNPNNNNNNNNTNTNSNTNMGHGSDLSNHSNNTRNHQMGVNIKNPKKRTRASRRAPTTVLTTDTTNFRQMVQEFTGIPAAPFTTGGPFSRRLDLFRPSPQKLQPQSILPPYSSNNNISTTGATSSSNYNLPPSNIHDQFQKQPSSLMDLQNNNPVVSFQSLLQTTLPHQQQSNHDLSGFSKRWRGQDEKMEGFEGVIGNNQNIGVGKLNSGLENHVVVSSSDQVQGNDHQASWICPSS